MRQRAVPLLSVYCLLIGSGSVTYGLAAGVKVVDGAKVDELTRGRRSDDGGPLETVVADLSRRVAQNEALTSQMAGMQARLGAAEKTVAQNKALTAKIAGLETRLAAAEKTVAFTATFKQSHITGLGPHQTVKWDRIITNVGDAYNPVTGFFIAPVPGTYLFNLHVMQHGQDKPVSLGIWNGATRYVRAYTRFGTDDVGSVSLAVHLDKGQQIHVQIDEGTSFFGSLDSYFSGVKISSL